MQTAARSVIIVRTIQYSRDIRALVERPRRTGCPAFAEHDSVLGEMRVKHELAFSRHGMSELFD